MDHGGNEPGREARGQDGCKGEAFSQTQGRGPIEQDAGQDSPERPPGEALHDLGVAVVFEEQPDQDQCPGQRHDADQTGQRGTFLCNESGKENYAHAERCLNLRICAGATLWLS